MQATPTKQEIGTSQGGSFENSEEHPCFFYLGGLPHPRPEQYEWPF